MAARRPLSILVTTVTWLFAIYSIILVARYGGAVLFDLSTTSRIMAVRTGEHIDSAIGLTYHALPGAILVATQLLAIIVALIASHTPRPALRRAGMLAILAWSSLWLANALWMESLSDGRHPTRAILFAVATASIAVWTILRWNPHPRLPQSPAEDHPKNSSDFRTSGEDPHHAAR